MKWVLFIFMHLLAVTVAFADPIKVAVIDTGAPYVQIQPCDEGSKDFTGTGLEDVHGHGSNISSIIDTYASGSDYCQIYLKYYTTKGDNLSTSIAAWKEAIRLKVQVINYSGGGTSFSSEEAKVVKEALDAGIFVFAAAGNEKTDLTKKCNYYPACLDSRIVKVGCKDSQGNLCPQSNHGKGVLYANGFQVKAGGQTLTGTSQATAIITGKFIKFFDKARKEDK